MLRIWRRYYQSNESVIGKRAGIFLLALFFVFSSLFSYEQKTIDKMVEGSVWLAPPSLKGLLAVYRKNILEGVTETMESGASLTDGELCLLLEEEMELLPRLAKKQSSFEQIAYHFGRAAAFVFLLNDPFRLNEEKEAKEISADYKKYIEKKLPRLILTFDGYSSPRLEKPLEKYFDKRRLNFPRYVDSVIYCYFPNGKRVSSQTFDDRSNAFGVAQIVLSKSVSDTAKVWVIVWKAMDGGTKGTPFLEKGGKK